MRPFTIGLAVLVLAALLLQALPATAAPRVAILEVKGMVCPA
jgi:hypothetical protein